MAVVTMGLTAEGMAEIDTHVVCPCKQDILIRHLLEIALQATGYQVLARLRCEVTAGLAVLQGEVPTYFLKQIAQETARHVQGIRVVQNLVEVTQQK